MNVIPPPLSDNRVFWKSESHGLPFGGLVNNQDWIGLEINGIREAWFPPNEWISRERKNSDSLLEDPGVPWDYITSLQARQAGWSHGRRCTLTWKSFTGHRRESLHWTAHRGEKLTQENNSQGGRTAHRGEKLTGERKEEGSSSWRQWEFFSYRFAWAFGQPVAPIKCCLVTCCRLDTMSKSRGCHLNCGKEAELCAESLSYQEQWYSIAMEFYHFKMLSLYGFPGL